LTSKKGGPKVAFFYLLKHDHRGFWDKQKTHFNRDFPLNPKPVIPAQAGIQIIKKLLQGRSNSGFVRYAECFSCWIPACAGMTGSNGKSGFNRDFPLDMNTHH
jgi:hypothetical protein